MLVLAFGALSVSAMAQEANGTGIPLNLTTGTEFLSPNLQGPTEWNISPGEQHNNRIYRIVQFAEIPDDAAKSALASQGVQFLEYLPTNAFVVSFPTSLVPLTLKNYNALAVAPLQTKHKLSMRLEERPLPEYAVKGSKVSVQVTGQQDVLPSSVAEGLLAYGFETELSKPHVNVVQGEIALAKLEQLASEPWVRYVDVAPEPGEKESDDGRNLHRSNSIDSDGYGGRQYDGDGVSVAVNDDGPVGPHIDFQGRVDQTQATNDLGTHGDMVAGIVGAAGNLDPTMRGMAPASFIWIRQYSGSLPGTLPLHLSDDVLIFQSSYSNGCNAGYTSLTRTVDQEIYNNPTLIQVFSAGNSNNNDCGYGAGSLWGNITGGHKMGKNVVATANLDNQDNLRFSSSRGPANDGRIKPDISAHGHNQMSTDPGNTYAPGGGTSAAAPGITGCMTQLHQAHRELNGGTTAESALLKAIMLNTANELGNIGPDFEFGFGKVNTLRALMVLEEGRYLKSSVAQNATNTHTFTVPAGTELAKVMVYWHDKEASTSAATALVNDLDAVVTQGGTTYEPYILNPAPNASTLDDPATTGPDHLNNVEQIPLVNPAAGTYTLTVDGTTVPFGPQDYYVVFEYLSAEPMVTFPMGGDNLEAGTQERIHWDAYGTNGSFTLEYTTDNGNNWNQIATNVSANSRFYTWSVPNTVTGQAKVRVTRNGLSDESDETFSIIGVPQNLNVDYACPDTIAISWSAVGGATSYDVYVLGTEFMDSVMTVTGTQAFLTGYSPNQELWISVRAETQEAKGRRAIAINKPIGTVNCVVSNDVALEQVMSPSGLYPTCQSSGAVQVKLIVENKGQNPASGFDVNYSFNSGTTVTETYTGTLNPGDTAHVSIQPGVTLTTGANNFVAWVSLSGDGNAFNDTLTTSPAILNGIGTQTLPYTEDFESFSNCGTANDCGGTNCSLTNGWLNAFNNVFDDIDWRTDQGGTASTGTGPTIDANPGTISGKYLYLEASGGCTFQEAVLMSPCFDLTNAQAPQMMFSYHMNGFSVGELHVDVLSDGVWYFDVTPALIGSQGGLWQERAVNLSPYAGTTVNIRFRGITGSDWSSDIALDNFVIEEATTVPTVDFMADPLSTCVGQNVSLFDLSANAPNQYSWSITPATYSFANGTNANSANPVVVFNISGDYDVQLIATNPIGSDTLLKSAYISVSNGESVPFSNDFESAPFPNQGFTIENPDGAQTWVANPNIVGLDGNNSVTAYINFYNYNASGQEDWLVSPIIDLTNTNDVQLAFDVSYAQYTANSLDGLRIEVSTDCGETFTFTPYERLGAALATVNPTTGNFSPSAASQWRRDTVDLSPFTGSSVQLRFVGICDYGNNLFLDNINLIDNSTTVALFTGDTMVCQGESIIFYDQSQGPGLTYNWTFENGSPASATTAGPHTITFNSLGTQNITLSVNGTNGQDNYANTIEVVEEPTAGFTSVYNDATGEMDFSFSGQYGQTVNWDFGDGTTATGFNVSHQYAAASNYTVTVNVSNPCGNDSYVGDVVNWPTGTAEVESTYGLSVFPNPFNGEVRIRATGIEGKADVVVMDLNGKQLLQTVYSDTELSNTVNLNLENLAQGVYVLRVSTDAGAEEIRIVKY